MTLSQILWIILAIILIIWLWGLSGWQRRSADQRSLGRGSANSPVQPVRWTAAGRLKQGDDGRKSRGACQAGPAAFPSILV